MRSPGKLHPRWIAGLFGRHRDRRRRFRLGPRIVVCLAVLAFFLICAIFASWIAPYDPLQVNLRLIHRGPSLAHLLGTDISGRDILSRLIWGSRLSLLVAVFSVLIGVIVGALLGVTAGYFGGKTDAVISRFLDIMLTLPSFILAIAFMGMFGHGLVDLILAIGFAMSFSMARLIRGAALSVKQNQFVEAARSFGYGDGRIILQHIIPHTLTPLVVYATFSLGTAILIEAGLSFLGIGIPPPAPSLGQMVAAGGVVIRELPWYSISSGLFIVVLILGFNMLGDGLRDHLDPRLKGEVR